METTLMTAYFEESNQNTLLHCSYESGLFIIQFEDTKRMIATDSERMYRVLKEYYNKKSGMKNLVVSKDSEGVLKGRLVPLTLNKHDVVTLKIDDHHYHLDRYKLFQAVMSFRRLAGDLTEKPKKGYYSYAHLEKYMETDEDWYPNIRENLVRVFILCSVDLNRKENPGMVRIGVWGDDDTGRDLDFYGTEEESINLFQKWKEEIYDKLPQPLNRDQLEELGFING